MQETPPLAKDFLSWVCEKFGIVVIELENNEENKPLNKHLYGISGGTGEEKFILMSGIIPPGQYRYTLAHEIGHHLLGHLDKEIPKEVRENEANIFAAVFVCMTLYEQWRNHYAPEGA